MAEPPTISGRIGLANSIVVKSATGSDRFYSTLALAKAGAVSGETIVLGPGSYSATANLAKNGVNWYLFEGATIAGVGNFDLFTDAGGVTSYSIGGYGTISLTGHGSCFIISNASSVIHAWASEVNQVSGSTPVVAAEGGFYQTAGEFHIKADKISGTVSAAYWDSGICFVDCDLLLGNGSSANAIYSQAAVAGQHWHVAAKEIKTTAGTGVQAISVAGDPASAIWITAHRIIAYDLAIDRNGPKLYINTQKIEATTTKFTSTNGMIKSQGGGFLYLTAQKIEALASANATSQIFYLTADGDSYIDVLQLVSAGVTDGVKIENNTGTHFLKIGRIDTKGNGVNFNSDTGLGIVSGATITSGVAKKDLIRTGVAPLETILCSFNPTKTTGIIPLDATDPGNFGTVIFDSSYIYICTATDTWKRVAIATWP